MTQQLPGIAVNARIISFLSTERDVASQASTVGRFEQDETGQPWVCDDKVRLKAKRAFSCLIEPEPGDRVAAWNDGDVCWVVAVLEREIETAPRLTLPSGTRIECAGALSVNSFESLTLRSAEVNVLSTTTRLAGDAMTSAHRRVDTYAGSASRVVDGVDRVSAQVLDQRGSTCATLKAPHVVLEGGELLKVRGAQIHMG